MSWPDRYNNESIVHPTEGVTPASDSIGHALYQAYQMIWPEGPKTMAEDVTNILRTTSDPEKRDQAKETLKHPLRTISQGVQLGVERLKDKFNKPDGSDSIVESSKKSWSSRYAARSREEDLEQARKLHALANDPSAEQGEAENAAMFRDKLIEKNNITKEELEPQGYASSPKNVNNESGPTIVRNGDDSQEESDSHLDHDVLNCDCPYCTHLRQNMPKIPDMSTLKGKARDLWYKFTIPFYEEKTFNPRNIGPNLPKLSWNSRYANEHDDDDDYFEERIQKNIENAAEMRKKVDNAFEEIGSQVVEMPGPDGVVPAAEDNVKPTPESVVRGIIGRDPDRTPGNYVRNHKWEQYPVAKQEDLPLGYLGSKGIMSMKWPTRYVKESGVFDNVPEEDYGTPEQLAEAKSVGVSRNMYNYLRSPNPKAHETEFSYEGTKIFIPTHENIIEMGKKGIEPFSYDAANCHGFMHKEILNIHDKGIDPGDYVEASNHGFSEQQIFDSKDLKGDIKRRFSDMVDAHKHGIDLDVYSYLRKNGATHEEILDSHKNGMNLGHYSNAREYGATHEEILDSHKNGMNLGHYAGSRDYGATHEEILDSHNHGIDLYDYYNAKQYGFTHEEILDAHKHDIDLGYYAGSKNYGATHEEILDAHNHGINLYDYYNAKQYGFTHEEILDTHKYDINLGHYSLAKRFGATHEEILDAHKHGIDLGGYSFARQSGVPHEKAINILTRTASWSDRYTKESSVATEALSLLTPAAILAQPFISDKINKHNEKKQEEEQKTKEEENNPSDGTFGTYL